MIVLRSTTHVAQFRGKEVFEFLLNPTDREYQRWWMGTHLELHPVKQSANGIGNVVYMDEFIGKRRLRMTGVVIEAVPGRKITWQLKKVVPLPVFLSLELEDDDEGVAITHTIRAGFGGWGRILDPILRVYFSGEFARAMDDHVKAEFPKLRDMLHG